MALEVASNRGQHRMLPAMAAVQEHATEAAAFLKALANDQRLLYYTPAKGPALQIMGVLYTAFCAPAALKKRAKRARCGPGKRN